MTTLLALYQQAPYWAWLGFAGVFVILALVTGVRGLLWPALAASIVAGLELAEVRLALSAEVALFLAFLVLVFIVPRRFNPTPQAQVAGLSYNGKAPKPDKREMGTMDRTGRLVGRIGRTTSEFANGVGRVWIEGAEWAAELESGEDGVPPEAPVRVTRIIGGVRLQVQGLDH